MKVHAKPDGLLDPKPWHLYFGRYLTFLLFNELQAAVIVTGDLFILGVQCENIGMFYLTGALTSFVFSLLIYSLAISFGDVGKAVVVVVMVLQIAARRVRSRSSCCRRFTAKSITSSPSPMPSTQCASACAACTAIHGSCRSGI